MSTNRTTQIPSERRTKLKNMSEKRWKGFYKRGVNFSTFLHTFIGVWDYERAFRRPTSPESCSGSETCRDIVFWNLHVRYAGSRSMFLFSIGRPDFKTSGWTSPPNQNIQFIHAGSRSRVNIPFRVGGPDGDEALEKEFVKEAKKIGLDGLAGHRFVRHLHLSLCNVQREQIANS